MMIMKQGIIKLFIFLLMQFTIAGVNASVELEGPILNAPNPFQFSQGTTLVYNLSQSSDVQLVMYDVRGQMILKRHFAAGTNGGRSHRNRVVISQHDFNGFGLSNGVYFYVLITNGKILGKGKNGGYLDLNNGYFFFRKIILTIYFLISNCSVII